jgi:hypothetical protein
VSTCCACTSPLSATLGRNLPSLSGAISATLEESIIVRHHASVDPGRVARTQAPGIKRAPGTELTLGKDLHRRPQVGLVRRFEGLEAVVWIGRGGAGLPERVKETGSGLGNRGRASVYPVALPGVVS